MLMKMVPPGRDYESNDGMTLVLERVLGSSSTVVLGNDGYSSCTVLTCVRGKVGLTDGKLADTGCLPTWCCIAASGEDAASLSRGIS